MTDNTKSKGLNLYLMAKNCQVYENRGEIKQALVLIDEILKRIGEVENNKDFGSWIYAHKGAVENQQMVKVVDMAADIYYRGYQDEAQQIVSAAIGKFKSKIVDWFNKALKDRENYNWAYSRLGEAYRQQAIRYGYLRLFQQNPEKNEEYYQEQKKALMKAKENFERGKTPDGYWNLAHLGATNYYLAIYKFASLSELWDRFEKAISEEAVDLTYLNKAEKNLEDAIGIAENAKLLYPWANVYLAATYGIKAKINEENNNFEEAERQWQSAFSTLLKALEEDSKIVASYKDMMALYERRMSICKTQIEYRKKEQGKKQLGQASPGTADILKQETKAGFQLLGELAETAQKSAQSALLNNTEDLELHHYSLAIARLEYHKLTSQSGLLTSAEGGENKSDENKRYFEKNLPHFGDNLNALEGYFNNIDNNSDANNTRTRLQELNEDYLRASLYLNQGFYEEKIKEPGYKSRLKNHLEQAEKYLKNAFSRSPKLLLKSYLDSTRSLYKDLQEKCEADAK